MILCLKSLLEYIQAFFLSSLHGLFGLLAKVVNRAVELLAHIIDTFKHLLQTSHGGLQFGSEFALSASFLSEFLHFVPGVILVIFGKLRLWSLLFARDKVHKASTLLYNHLVEYSAADDHNHKWPSSLIC